MSGVAGRSGGRNARTVAEHRLAGTFRPARHSNQRNPEPPKGRPDPPKPLEGDAAAEWEMVCAELEAAGALATTDRMLIYQYARLFAETEDLSRLRDETGGSVDRLEENLSGLEGAELVQCFQEITKLRTLQARYAVQVRLGRVALLRFLVEIGHTPTARSRVTMPMADRVEDESAELARLLAIR